jgi:hypothetical protein
VENVSGDLFNILGAFSSQILYQIVVKTYKNKEKSNKTTHFRAYGCTGT